MPKKTTTARPRPDRQRDAHAELHAQIAAEGGGITNGRIPMTDAEHHAVDELLAAHGEQAGLTRRDPGETGPVVVHLGDRLWEIAADGSTVEVTPNA